MIHSVHRYRSPDVPQSKRRDDDCRFRRVFCPVVTRRRDHSKSRHCQRLQSPGADARCGRKSRLRHRLREIGYKPPTPEQEAEIKKRIAEWKGAIDPMECGMRALKGMRRNDLYILSHPEWEQIMRQRHEASMAALPRGVSMAHERESKSSEMTHESICAAGFGKRC